MPTATSWVVLGEGDAASVRIARDTEQEAREVAATLVRFGFSVAVVPKFQSA